MNNTYLQIVAHALTANEVPTILKKRISLSFVEGIAAQDGHSSFKIDLEDVQTRKAAIIAHCFCVAMSGNSEDGIAFSKRSLGFIRDLLMDDNEKFQWEDSAHAILNMISEWNERSSEDARIGAQRDQVSCGVPLGERHRFFSLV